MTPDKQEMKQKHISFGSINSAPELFVKWNLVVGGWRRNMKKLSASLAIYYGNSPAVLASVQNNRLQAGPKCFKLLFGRLSKPSRPIYMIQKPYGGHLPECALPIFTL